MPVGFRSAAVLGPDQPLGARPPFGASPPPSQATSRIVSRRTAKCRKLDLREVLHCSIIACRAGDKQLRFSGIAG